MTDPATHGDTPTIDQARAIAAAGLRVLPNHTSAIRERYTDGSTHKTTPRGSCEANTGSGTNSVRESQR